MKCVSFTLINCINKLQEVFEDSKKDSARFKRGDYNNFFYIQNPYENSK